MPAHNHSKTYNAADIENYHRGLLTNTERNALEKAAMEDPFLADALEGYSVSGVQAADDITSLRKQLSERIGREKSTPMYAPHKRRYFYLRVAAFFLFLAGASLLVYQFGFNKKKEDIAQLKPAATNDSNLIPDSMKASPSGPVIETEKELASKRVSTDKKESGNGAVAKEGATLSPGAVSEEKKEVPVKEILSDVNEVKNESTVQPKIVNPSTSSPAVPQPEKSSRPVVQDKLNDAKKSKEETFATRDRNITDQDLLGNQKTSPSAAGQSRSADIKQRSDDNMFRGRVTDAENRGIPFANLTVAPLNNVSTYTDAKGFFNLTAPDTAITVQVSNFGMERAQVQLRSSETNNQVVLKDPARSLSETESQRQQSLSMARKREVNKDERSAEPTDGWENYERYLLNNLKVPPDYNTNLAGTGMVVLSFEIDKKGRPVRIKIKQSLQKSCDREALRLVQDGPQWKSNGRNSKASLTITF